MTVIEQDDPDHYRVLDEIHTQFTVAPALVLFSRPGIPQSVRGIRQLSCASQNRCVLPNAVKTVEGAEEAFLVGSVSSC
jgi:hypothetical protein